MQIMQSIATQLMSLVLAYTFKMESSGEHEAVNALIKAVDAELIAFKQQRLKAYPKEYYSKPKNRQRRNKYSKQYQQLLKLKTLK